MSGPQLTVAICSHNPDSAVISRLVAALVEQTLPASEWELLLVDNCSSPAVRNLVSLAWHPDARVLEESELGIIHGRLRAAREARSDLVLFLDDDTIPDRTYLETGLRFMRERPFLGVLGGYGRAEFTAELPEWMRDFRVFYLDFDYSPERQEDFQYARTHIMGPWIPPTAGMIVRRSILDAYAQAVQSDALRGQLGRRGRGDSASLQGGEDEDIALTAIDQGLASGMTRQMTYLHVIPAWRMKAAYLAKMLYSSNYSTARLLVRRGLKRTAPAPLRGWSWKLRQIKLKRWARDPSMLCWVALQRGYQDGLAGAEPDPFFIQAT